MRPLNLGFWPHDLPPGFWRAAALSMASSPTPLPASASARRRPASPLLARLALVAAAPIVFFCALEGGLRLAGFGESTDLFIPDDTAGFFRTNPHFTDPFIPASFGIQPLNFRIARHKQPNALRVFVLGESAAQGIPEPEFGFASQLRAQLRARFPGRTVELFNLGITAINSHVVYRAARQAAAFEPDLFVVYMGNNEVVGPYGPGCAYLSATPPIWFIRASVRVRSTRTGQLLGQLLSRWLPSGSKAREWKGMETFADNSVRGNDPRLQAVYRNYSANLKDILDLAGRAGIRTVLATVIANLSDSPPFISLHRTDLSPADKTSWNTAFDAGTIAADLGDPASARIQYTDALRLDPEYAETHFRLGKLSEELGESAAARTHYLDALHWDALRFRPDTPLNEIVRKLARDSPGSAFLVDVARALGSDPQSVLPLAGRDILFDHVHFNWEGNFRVAALLADECAHALEGPDVHPGPGLDAAGCADAIGFTPEGRLKMLEVIVQLTLHPPFTGQTSFSTDQAALRREIELLRAQTGAPGEHSRELAKVSRARVLDPGNAQLAVRLAAMESEADEPDRALSLIEAAGALLPSSADLLQRKAEILMHLGRYDQAEGLLLASLRRDPVYFSACRPLVGLWTRTQQFDKGKRFFDQALEKAPSNPYLRLEYANLLVQSGDREGAELQARAIWDSDPTSRPAMAALELRVRLYEEQHRQDAYEALTLEARPHQPDDYYNNQRLVQIYAARKDPAATADCLLALAASGPFDSTQHLDLAHRLADLDRGKEMLDELARAGAIARIEGNAAQIRAIDTLIETYRSRFSEGKAR
jgi:tetratricopeptide (TPR) repeat protein